jgi:hypothetical protein
MQESHRAQFQDLPLINRGLEAQIKLLEGFHIG